MKGVLFYFALFHLFSFIFSLLLFLSSTTRYTFKLHYCWLIHGATLRKSTREHNKRMKLLRMALPRRMRPRSIFFFQGVRAYARSKRCARKYLRSYILSRYSIPEWGTYTNPIPAGSKKTWFISDLCMLMNREIFLRFLVAPRVFDEEIEGCATDIAFLQRFRYTLPSLIPASPINRRRLDRAFCAHWMIISCVFANKYQHLLPE